MTTEREVFYDIFGMLDETVSIDHIKRGYYSIKALNPAGIVPVGPSLSWGSLRGS